MAKEKPIVVQGEVLADLSNANFKVLLDINGSEIICHPSGNMRKNYIKVLPGDRVEIEMSPYDMTRGRITRRY